MFRLFVALYPPIEVRRSLLKLLAETLPDAANLGRIQPADQLHMTLQFIGDTGERELQAVAESVERSGAGIEPFELIPTRLITLPERGPARNIAIQTDAPGSLIEIHSRLAKRLARSARARASDRFLPHITLLRYSGTGVPRRVECDVRAPAFTVSTIHLVRSILKPAGADHVSLLEVPLG